MNFILCLLLVVFSNFSFGKMMFKVDDSVQERAERYAQSKNVYIVQPLTQRSKGKIEITDVLKGHVKPHIYNCSKDSLFLELAQGKGLWIVTSDNNKDICKPDYIDLLSSPDVIEALKIALDKKGMKLNEGYSFKRFKKIAEKSDFKFDRIVETGPGPVEKKSDFKEEK